MVGTNPTRPRGGRLRLLPLLIVPALLGAIAFGGPRLGSNRPVAAAGELPLVPPVFHLNDGPTWFDTGVDLFGTHSLAVALPGTSVKFIVGLPDTATDHDPDSVIWPTGAEGMPFRNDAGFVGEKSVTLTTPGLYAFQCTIHPYMLGAVLVLDPTALANGQVADDFGKMLSVRGIDKPLPSDSDYIYRLVHTFFMISNQKNWRRYHEDKTVQWMPQYVPAPVVVHDANGIPQVIPNLEAFMHQYFHEPITLPAIGTMHPKIPGVGEVLVDTQMEDTNQKPYPGTSAAVDTTTWKVVRKFGLPGANDGTSGFDNPHNMWTNRDETEIYQDEWFSNRTTTFDRYTGQFLRSTVVGPSPAHVLTRPKSDELIVGINGGNSLAELTPDGTAVEKQFSATLPGEGIAHPHAHTLTADGNTAVAPNANFDSASVFNLNAPDPDLAITKRAYVGSIPIASWTSPTGDKAYVASLMSNQLLCMSLAGPACHDGGRLVDTKIVSLTRGYDYVTGAQGGQGTGLPLQLPPLTSDFGGAAPGLLPIQMPISPDGKYLLSANAASGNISVVSMATDEVVKTLPCDPGCHGINFGAKQGGGYYGYVSTKFGNTMLVVDADPAGDGDLSKATVAGRVILDSTSDTKTDVTPKDDNTEGMGGQGVLALPLVYNGWVQQLPPGLRAGLTCDQLHPVDPRFCR